MRVRRRDDSGVTLIEMLAALVVLGIIIVPLTGAVIIGLKTTGTTSLRLTQSHDRQLVEVYFPRDVFSASAAQVNTTSSECYTAGQSVVVLTWKAIAVSDPPVPTTLQQNYEADYVLENGGLTRYLCTGGAPTSFTVAYRIASSNGAVAVVNGKSVSLTLTDSSGVTYVVTGQERS